MITTVLHRQIQAIGADTLILSLTEGDVNVTGQVASVDTALGSVDGMPGQGAIARLLQLGDFSGKLNQIAVLYTNGLIPAPRVILVGLGKPERVKVDHLRQASGVAVRRARDLGCRRVASMAHGLGLKHIDPADAAQATVEGALMGVWRFVEHKSGGNDRRVEQLVLVAPEAGLVDRMAAAARAGEIVARAVNTSRDLISQPANVMTPPALADAAIALAREAGLSCTVLDERAIAGLGMGGLLAVAQGSAHPPRFAILEHVGESGRPLVFIGKGVTFDSGGLSLKEPAGMESMKADMSGAAAVIGAMQAIAQLGLPRRVIGIAPLVENMPDGRAYRPGDIVKMMSGHTVEIISTDAEGRMTLADALHFARRYQPAGVVDLATLTGASVVALGEGVAAALFANDRAWAGAIRAAAAFAGERLWRMPLYAQYAGKLRSQVADLKNTAGRTGGVGASAYFLRRFVEGEGAYPWAHIDMAGMTFTPDSSGYHPSGPIGFGVRTLIRLALIFPERGGVGV